MCRHKALLNLCGSTLLLLSACSTQPRQALIPSVGPAPVSQPSPGSDGYLLVYSAWSNFVDPGSTGHHSRYTISSEDGKASRVVINHVDRFDEGPVRLALAPGAYHVRARSAHFGRVTVPVVIRPHQTTFVYLDGSEHGNGPANGLSDAVKLPDGEVVGWSTMAKNGNP